MAATRLQRDAARRAADTRRTLARQLLHLREDAGLTQEQLAAAAGVTQAYVARIEAGTVRPTVEAYAALSAALGSDLSVRIYPNTGPLVRDRHQAPIVESLLRLAAPEWQAFPEVPVTAPTRGVIDLVLHRGGEPPVMVAAEIESNLARLEQRLRWHAEKADALPSSRAWAAANAGDGRASSISRLLVLRSTRTHRDIARSFEETLRAAYPATTAGAHRALRDATVWPGAAILWARVETGAAEILPTPPRGVRLGR